MHFSKADFKILSLSIFGALAFSGCFRPGTHSVTDSNGGLATFQVASVSGKSEVLEQDANFSIPVKKRFNLSACLKDRRTEVEVKNTRFVMEIDGDNTFVTTDSNGCVKWTEDLSFNYLSEETYIHRKRIVKAAEGGRHSGSQPIEAALNPWNFSGQAAEVVDVSTGAPAKAKMIEHSEMMKAASDGGKSFGRTLGIDLLNLTAVHAAEGAGLNRVVRIGVHPSFEIGDESRAAQRIDLKDAKLKISAALIALITGKDGVETAYLAWSTTDAISMQKEKNLQRANLPVSFEPLNPEQTHYQLAIKIEPAFGPSGLNAFEGLLELGSHSQFASNVVLPEKIADSNLSGGTFNYVNTIRGLPALPRRQVEQPPAAPEQTTVVEQPASN